jgi:multidrug efflux pump subunit AcrB
MYKIWQFFLLNDRFSYLLILALLGFGFFSIVNISKESAPEVQIPVGVVQTVLLGAPASDIETLITNEIERGLKGSLKDVKKITSTSREGVSIITVEFDANADIDESIDELKDQVDIIKNDLPSEAEDPIVSEVNFVDQPIMMVALSGDFSDEEFVKLADEIENEIESLTGISRIEFSGIRDREVSVIVSQTALDQFGLTLGQVQSGLRSANQTLPIGQIKSSNVIYNIAFEGDIRDTTEIANIAIANIEGTPIYVRDIAEVVDGLGNANRISRLSIDGQPSVQAVTFSVFKQRGGDITAITKSVRDKLIELQNTNEILEFANVKVVLDAGSDIKKDLIRLSSSGLQTVILVIMILIFAIGWREGLVAGVAIPLSFLIGFIGLYVSGNTINFVSLFALILAIGILVDSAIVMVEGINRRMKEDLNIDKRQAALLTIKEFATPLMTGTMTTVAMFSGLFLVGGITGQFIAAIPFTINFILLASLLVALGFIPLIAATFLRRRNATKFEQIQTQKARQLEDWYKQKLSSILGDAKKERIFIWSLRILLVMALLLPITGVVKVIFFEQSDIDFIYAEVELPQGSIKEDTDIAVRRLEEVLYQEPEIESFTVTIGSGSDFGSGGSDEKIGSALINLKEDRINTSTEIIESLREKIVDIRDIKVTIDQPSDGPPTGEALGYRFLGDDLEQLTTISEIAAEILKDIEFTTNVTTSATNNSTEFVIQLQKAKAASLGLDPFTISQTIRTAVYGSTATTLNTLNEEIDVVVKLNLTNEVTRDINQTNVTSIETIKNLQLRTGSGVSVPLSSVADITLRESSSVIRHECGNRVVSLSGGISEGGNVSQINEEFSQKLKEANLLTEDIRIEIGGETEESNQAFIEMFLALIVGIMLMVGVLVLQFNSYLHTKYVLTILPYSLIGIMVGLAITRLPLSFPSLMGFIALSGIVVNNSILLIDVMNENRRKNPNSPIRDLVIDSAASRLRPILLTTFTTVFGMIPLTYASDLWSPLAYAIMFGLLFSVIITLVLVPIAYLRKPGKV